jgi:lipid A 3-O-deacylase
MKKVVFLFFLLCNFVYAIKDADLLSFGAGVNNCLRDNTTAECRIEYKSHLEFLRFRPMVGFMMTFRKALYAYGGVGLDLYPKPYLVFSPNFAAGYYNKGNGKDLGFPLEFRSGIELALRFDNLSRFGVHFYHVSNAKLGSRNPGMESLVFFFAIPTYRSK